MSRGNSMRTILVLMALGLPMAQAQGDNAEKLMKASDCSSCHAVDRRDRGSSLQRHRQAIRGASRCRRQAGCENSRWRQRHDASSRFDGCAAERDRGLDSVTKGRRARLRPRSIPTSSRTAQPSSWTFPSTPTARAPRSPRKFSTAISSSIRTAIAAMEPMRRAASSRRICGIPSPPG